MVRESTASWIQKSLTKKKWKNYHECIETSFTKITYEKVKKTNINEDRNPPCWNSHKCRFLVSTKEKKPVRVEIYKKA